uniref:NECAP PHear domain-containing protein n=1 Tax=Meloidogyne javanica TaxID=6303 RepID=A0A915MU31_MELJA
MLNNDFSAVLLVKREVFLYMIPPLSGTKGYKASDWNLANPNWTGRLRLVSKSDDVLEIRLEDKNTGELFAKAPINRLNSIDFEPVVDSSRYFVIRLRSDNGQARFVGIGFSDQSDSFDLKVSIQDYFRSALEVEKEIKAEESGINKIPKKTIVSNDNQRVISNKESPKNPGSTTTSFPLLPPPPPSSSSPLVRR